MEEFRQLKPAFLNRFPTFIKTSSKCYSEVATGVIIAIATA
jgi:hypothetical protein